MTTIIDQGDDTAIVQTMSELLDLHTRVMFGRLHTGCVARVITYNAQTQAATVQPVARQRYIADPNTSERVPSIPNVPVCWPQGGGFAITFPLEAGDDVFLSFADRSIDEWKRNASGDYTPALRRRFDLADAIAIPISSPSQPLVIASATDLVIGVDNQTGLKIAIDKQNKISIGTPSVDLLALLDSLLAAIDTFTNATSAAAIEPTLAPASVTLKASASAIKASLATIKKA